MDSGVARSTIADEAGRPAAANDRTISDRTIPDVRFWMASDVCLGPWTTSGWMPTD